MFIEVFEDNQLQKLRFCGNQINVIQTMNPTNLITKIISTQMLNSHIDNESHCQQPPTKTLL
jgi:hypothetical protein